MIRGIASGTSSISTYAKHRACFRPSIPETWTWQDATVWLEQRILGIGIAKLAICAFRYLFRHSEPAMDVYHKALPAQHGLSACES